MSPKPGWSPFLEQKQHLAPRGVGFLLQARSFLDSEEARNHSFSSSNTIFNKAQLKKKKENYLVLILSSVRQL